MRGLSFNSTTLLLLLMHKWLVNALVSPVFVEFDAHDVVMNLVTGRRRQVRRRRRSHQVHASVGSDRAEEERT